MASYEESLVSITLDADESVGVYTGVPGLPGSAVPNSGNQYRFLKVTGKHQVGLATGTGDKIVGVLQNKPQYPGSASTVAISGVSLVAAGGAVAAGDPVTTDGEGRGVVGAIGTDYVVGVAVEDAGAAGHLFPVLLK